MADSELSLFSYEIMGLIGPIVEVRRQVRRTGFVGTWQFVLDGPREGTG